MLRPKNRHVGKGHCVRIDRVRAVRLIVRVSQKKVQYKLSEVYQDTASQKITLHNKINSKDDSEEEEGINETIE